MFSLLLASCWASELNQGRPFHAFLLVFGLLTHSHHDSSSDHFSSCPHLNALHSAYILRLAVSSHMSQTVPVPRTWLRSSPPFFLHPCISLSSHLPPCREIKCASPSSEARTTSLFFSPTPVCHTTLHFSSHSQQLIELNYASFNVYFLSYEMVYFK